MFDAGALLWRFKMVAKKSAGKSSIKAGDTEARVVALAEQLGWFLGTVQGKAEGWLSSEKLRGEVVRIRDGAAQLLQHVDAAARSAVMGKGRLKAADKQGVVVAGSEARKIAKDAKPSRGAVDAPGKRHRKPPPQESINKRMASRWASRWGRRVFRSARAAAGARPQNSRRLNEIGRAHV